jgi:amino-acid N-acetyltransferase
MKKINLRCAKISDSDEIYELIESYAKNGEMLHRSLNSIYKNIQKFMVIEEKNKIIGCGSLHISLKDLAEIKSLAVNKNSQRQGVAKKIVEKLQYNALYLGIHKIFVLSFKPIFFKKLGYKIVSKKILPHKIWNECINCYLFQNCREIPLMKNLNDH